MTNEEIYEKLGEIFQNVFMDDSIKLTPATTAADIEDWDSLMHITLISIIEAEFGIKFSAKQTTEMKNIGEMAEAIKELMETK